MKTFNPILLLLLGILLLPEQSKLNSNGELILCINYTCT